MDLRTKKGREELRQRIHQAVDIPLDVLAGLLLVLLVLELTLSVPPEGTEALALAGGAIWLIFIADFLVELALAASKTDYLRHNWLIAISVIVPFFRFFLVFRALRATRLVTLFTGLNRGTNILREVFSGRGLPYVAALTAGVILLSSAGIYFFERTAPGSTLATFGDVLWWVSASVTQINAQDQPKTPEGRIIGVAVGFYGLAIFGYLAGIIASYLVSGRTTPQPPVDEALRREIQQLRRELNSLTEAINKAEFKQKERQRGPGRKR